MIRNKASAPGPLPARIARRMRDIQPFHVMDLLAEARRLEAQGQSIVHMEIGEPDFVSPPGVIEAGRHALAQGRTHYTPAAGLPELRAAIARFYQDRYRVDIAPERILVTPGSSGALQLALSVLVDPGDRVLMADPGYPCNRNFVRLVEGESVPLPVDAASGYQLSAQHLLRHWSARTTAVLAASPANPTGTIISGNALRELVASVEQRGAHLIMDEIYHGLVYEGDVTTALAYSDEVFVVNSFSKFFGMTGWRVGWLVAPASYVRAAEKLAQNLYLAAPTVSQYGAIAALEPSTLALLEARRVEFQQRRDWLLPALRDLGFELPMAPQGAFYLYAGCRAFCHDSYAFAMELLQKAGVAIAPGVDFGAHEAATHVRFAYTTSLDRLQAGVSRLQAHLGAA